MKVTNIDKGPRGLNTKNGPVLLDPGQTRDDIDLSAAERKVAESTGWFEFGKPPEPAGSDSKPPGGEKK